MILLRTHVLHMHNRALHISLLALTMLLLFLPNTKGQSEIVWSKNYGGDQDETFQDIFIDNQNGAQVIGYSQSTVGPIKGGKGLYDMLICAMSLDGTLTWSNSIGGSKNDLGKSILINNENTFVGGLTYSSDKDITSNLGGGDILFGTLDNEHNLATSSILGGNSLDNIVGIKMMLDGSLILVANTNSTDVNQTGVAGGTDIYIARLLPDGIVLWETILGKSGVDKASDLVINAQGEIIIVGTTFSSDFLTFKKGIKDGFVLCMNKSGEMIWGKRFGNGNYANLTACDVDGEGNILVTGTQGQINPAGSGINGNYNDDIWVLKTDAQGEEIWRKVFGGKDNESATDILSTIDGGILVVGNSISFDGIVNTNFGGKDAIALKLNRAGQKEWSKGYGGSLDDTFNAVAQDQLGQYWLIGQTASSDIHLTENNGGNDAWILKLKGKAPELSIELGGPIAVCEGEQITLDATLLTCDCQYSWSDGVQGAIRNFSAEESTSLSITVTDNAGNVASDNLLINVNKNPLFELATAPISCADGSDGQVIASIVTAAPPLLYTWSESNTLNQEVITALSSGLYQLTLTDGNNCSALKSISLTDPEPIQLSALSTAAICDGNLGSVQLAITGGNAPYTINWQDGQSTNNLNDLPAGNYAVTVSDVTGCSTKKTFSVAQESVDFQLDFIIENNTCHGFSDGNIIILNDDKIESFQWSTGAQSASVSELSAGIHTLDYTTIDGCAGQQSFTIIEPNSLQVEAVVVNNSCADQNEGSITLLISGGTAPYIMAWDNGEDTPLLDELSAGRYTVTINDENGCALIFEEEISAPNNIALDFVDISHVSCLGQEDGQISVAVTGGSGAYDFIWSTGSNGPILSDLTAGLYQVSITDEFDCITILDFEIEEASSLPQVSILLSDPLCHGEATGSVTLSPAMSAGELAYIWEDGFLGSERDDLSAGLYKVTVGNQAGCTETFNLTLVEPDVLEMRFVIEEISCFEATDGAIQVNISGGTTPYSLSLENEASQVLGLTSNQQIENLSAGLYFVELEDANGCRLGLPLVLVQPDEIAYSTDFVSPDCFGSDNGQIALEVSGGKGSFTFDWSDGDAQTPIRTGLTGGAYQVTITDEASCIEVVDLALTQPAPILIAGQVTDVLCFGNLDGAVTTNATGGVGQLNYFWGGTFDTNSIENFPAGIYKVEVTDENNCLSDTIFLINEPAPIEVDQVVLAPGPSAQNGSVELLITGGTAPYEIIWEHGATGPQLSNLSSGTYPYEIIDANDCILAGSVLLQTSSTTQSALDGVLVYPNPSNETLFINTDIDYTDINLSLQNALGQTIYHTQHDNFSKGIHPISVGQLPAGIYYLTLAHATNKGVYKIVVDHP